MLSMCGCICVICFFSCLVLLIKLSSHVFCLNLVRVFLQRRHPRVIRMAARKEKGKCQNEMNFYICQNMSKWIAKLG